MRVPFASLAATGVAAATAIALVSTGAVDAPGCAEAQAQTTQSVEGRLDCRSACLATAAIPAASARRRGAGLRLAFRRRDAGRVRVDILRAASGRRVTPMQRVVSFGARRRGLTWSGRVRGRAAPDGIYVARFRAEGETRRVALRRSRGRFARQRDYIRSKSCDSLSAFGLSSPAFGGRSRRPLRIAYRLSQPARVSVAVRRGRRIVKRFRARRRAPGRAFKLRLPAGRPGTYRVTLVAKGTTSTVRATLGARGL